jgi:DNA-binding SARP family transcriptional activator
VGGPGGATLRVRLLGGLGIEGIDDVALGSRKGRLLVKALAVARGAPVRTDRLVEILWGDDPPARPAEQVGVLVSRLRGVLGADRIVRTDAGLVLRADWLDVEELEARVAEAAAALGSGRAGSARSAAAAAVALARGEVLPEEDGDWVEGARATARAVVGRAHQLAAEAAATAGDHGGAAAAAEAALALDPYDEVALRTLMAAHASAGRPASALAAYVRVRDRVVEDLGVDLSPETEALHDRLVLEPPVVVPAAGASGAGRPVLVGRKAELAALAGHLDAVGRAGDSGGGAALVVVRGEPGAGKSALVDAFVSDLGDRATVLRGRCDELGRDLPLQPIADALAEQLRTLGEDAAAAVAGPELPAIGPLVGLGLGRGGDAGPDDAVTATVPDAEAGRAGLFAALVATIERLGGGRPVVLAIDDLHLAGRSTLAWLAFARRRGRGLLLLATTRPGPPSPAGAEELALGPLDATAVAELLPELDAERRAALLDRSGGNPLFLLALARSIDGAHGAALPDDIRSVVDSRVAMLGPAATSLRAAATLGTDVDLDLLADVLGRPALEVLGDLEAALAAGILVERGNGLAFGHDLVREAIEATTTAARRALVHRDAARALSSRTGVDALAVAVHARLGGDLQRAEAAYVEAGRQALARYDTDAAAEHLDTAIGLGGSAAALVVRARVRLGTFDLDRAATDASEALALDGGAEALEVAAWVAYYQRRFADAVAHADRGVVAAGDDLARRASCLAVAGRIRHGRGELADAVERFVVAEGAPPPVQGVVDVWLGFVRVHEGRPQEALAVLQRPLSGSQELAHPWAGLHGRFARVMALGQRGRIAEALRVCDDLDAAVARTGVIGARFLGPTSNVRSWILRHAGAGPAADDLNRSVLDRTTAPTGGPLGDAVAEFHYVALLDLADGRLAVGDVAGAAALVDELAGVDRWQGTMAWHQRHRLGLLRGRLACLDGDADAAAELAGAVAADAAARGARRYEVLGRTRAALATGDAGGVDGLVAGLDSCARLEGWRLLVELADRFGIDALRAEAAARAASLVAAAGDQADALRREVDAALR